jgi:hypothetical protein
MRKNSHFELSKPSLPQSAGFGPGPGPRRGSVQLPSRTEGGEDEILGLGQIGYCFAD